MNDIQITMIGNMVTDVRLRVFREQLGRRASQNASAKSSYFLSSRTI